MPPEKFRALLLYPTSYLKQDNKTMTDIMYPLDIKEHKLRQRTANKLQPSIWWCLNVVHEFSIFTPLTRSEAHCTYVKRFFQKTGIPMF